MNGRRASGSPTEDGIPVDAHKKLIAYTIGPQDIDLTFRNRVAHENGWDLAKAERAVQGVQEIRIPMCP